jgi:hypothetical protein
MIRHENKFHYYDSIPVMPLGAAAKANRMAFCRQQLARADELPVIFTDQSMICQDLNKGGIWRRKGEFLDEGTFEQHTHPLSVMVWGDIGTGSRSRLLRCSIYVNAKSYMRMLAEGHIFWFLEQRHGPQGFSWQPDNAPAYGPGRTVIQEHHHCLSWPGKSPNLSPIETVWSIIKRQIKGQRFPDADARFSAIVQAWDSIPQEVINNLFGSFPARREACARLGGASLNGHWGVVHQLHHRMDSDETPLEPAPMDV